MSTPVSESDALDASREEGRAIDGPDDAGNEDPANEGAGTNPDQLDLGQVDLQGLPKSREIDLGSIVLGGTEPTTQKFDLRRHRESSRDRIANILMFLLFAICVGLVTLTIIFVRPLDREVVALLMGGILTPVIAIVGTVVGFYFGQESKSLS